MPKYSILMLMCCILWVGCLEKKDTPSDYRQKSSGPLNVVSVFAKEDLYETLKPSLRDSTLFGKIFPGLYYPPEVMFGTRHFEANLFDRFQDTRLILKVSKGVQNIVFEEDKYARPQAYVEVFGNDTQEIIDVLVQNQDSLRNFYRSVDRRFMLGNLADRSHDYTPQLDKLGVKMIIPSDFVPIENNDHFAWYKKETFNTITNRHEADNGIVTQQSHDILNILFYKVPFQSNELTLEKVIEVRDSIAKLYTKGSKEPQEKIVGKDSIKVWVTDHAQTEQNPILRDLYELDLLKNTENTAIYEAHGYWSMTLTQMGGPFTMKLIWDKPTKTLYVADAFIFAPLNQGKSKKRDYLTQMEGLFTTFQLKPQKDES